MNLHVPNETIVTSGTFLYDGKTECDIRIILSPVHYGNGDYDNSPEEKNDIEHDTFYIQFGSTTENAMLTL